MSRARSMYCPLCWYEVLERHPYRGQLTAARVAAMLLEAYWPIWQRRQHKRKVLIGSERTGGV